MAVTSVREIWQGRRAGMDDRGERTYQRTFRAITDSTLTGQLSVMLATGIPRRFDVYTDPDGTLDTAAFVRRVEAKQDGDNPYIWLVDAEYGSKLEQPEYGDEDPLARPAEVEWDQVKYTRPIAIDRDGRAIVNSAGEMFDPPIEVEDCRTRLTISRNEIAYDQRRASDFIGRINKTAWFGFAKEQVLCMGIKGKRQYEKGLTFWSVTYEFETCSGETWAVRVLDQGYKKIAGGTRVAINDPKTGLPVSTPAHLDGAGGVLAFGAADVFLTFNLYNTREFSEMNLP